MLGLFSRQATRTTLRYFNVRSVRHYTTDAASVTRAEFFKNVRNQVKKYGASTSRAHDTLRNWFHNYYDDNNTIADTADEQVTNTYLYANYACTLSQHPDQKELAKETLQKALNRITHVLTRSDLSQEDIKDLTYSEHFANICLGMANERLNNLEEAEKAFVNAMKYDPTIIQVLLKLYQLSRNMKNVEKQQHYLDIILKHYPNDLDTHLGIARFHLEQSNIEKVEQFATSALSLSKNRSVDALLMKAHVATVRKEFEAAEKLLRQALKIDPEEYRAANSLGLLLTKQGRWTEARDLLKRSLDLTSDQNADIPHLYAHLDFTLRGVKAIDSSEKFFLLALQIHDHATANGAPDTAEVSLPLLRDYAHFLMDTKKTSKASPFIERAKNIDENDLGLKFGEIRIAEQSETLEQVSQKYENLISDLEKSIEGKERKRLILNVITRYAHYLKRKNDPSANEKIEKTYAQFAKLLEMEREEIDEHAFNLLNQKGE